MHNNVVMCTRQINNIVTLKHFNCLFLIVLTDCSSFISLLISCLLNVFMYIAFMLIPNIISFTTFISINTLKSQKIFIYVMFCLLWILRYDSNYLCIKINYLCIMSCRSCYNRNDQDGRFSCDCPRTVMCGWWEKQTQKLIQVASVVYF